MGVTLAVLGPSWGRQDCVACAREAALSRYGEAHALWQYGSVRRMLYREVEGEGGGGAGEVGDPAAPAFRAVQRKPERTVKGSWSFGEEQADPGAGKGQEGR